MAAGNVTKARALLDAGSYREAGELFVAAGDLASAARAFVAARDLFRAAVCYEKALKPLDAARLYQQIRHWGKAAELFAQAGDTLQAEIAREQLLREQAAAASAQGQATRWAQAPIPAAAAPHVDAAPGPARADGRADERWPAGEVWQAIRRGDIPGAAAVYLRLGGNPGWGLLAEASSPGALRGLAETLLHAGEHAVAAEAFQKLGESLRAAQCLSLAGLNEEAAHLFYNLGERSLAAQHLEKAHAWGQAAAIYAQEGLFLDAARCHEKEDDPTRAAALYLKAGKADLALPLLQSVPAGHRSFTPSRLLAAKILFQKGQHDLAVSMLAPLLQAGPGTEDGLEAFYQAAVLMHGGGATERARQAYLLMQETRFGYRDVTERLQQLAAPASPSAAGQPSPVPPSPAPPPARAHYAPQAAGAPAPADEPEIAPDLADDLPALRSCSLFGRLGLEDLRRIWGVGKSGEVKPGKVLVRAGEAAAGLMIVLSGGVTLTPDPTDPTAASGFLGPGDYVGLGSLLKGPPLANHLVAQRNTRLLVLPPAAFDTLLATEPEMGLRFYRSVAEHLVKTLTAGTAGPARI